MRSAITEARRATTTAENFVRARDWPTGVGDIAGTQLLDLLRTVPGIGQTTALTLAGRSDRPAPLRRRQAGLPLIAAATRA